MLGWTKQNCSKYFEISKEIWDNVSLFTESQQKDAKQAVAELCQANAQVGLSAVAE